MLSFHSQIEERVKREWKTKDSHLLDTPVAIRLLRQINKGDYQLVWRYPSKVNCETVRDEIGTGTHSGKESYQPSRPVVNSSSTTGSRKEIGWKARTNHSCVQKSLWESSSESP